MKNLNDNLHAHFKESTVIFTLYFNIFKEILTTTI